MTEEKITMDKTYIIEDGQKPTKEELEEVESAKKQPIRFDDDCPELSPAMLEFYAMKKHPDQYKRYSSFKDAVNDVLNDHE